MYTDDYINISLLCPNTTLLAFMRTCSTMWPSLTLLCFLFSFGDLGFCKDLKSMLKYLNL